jgi:hypothetical protein
MPNGTIERTRPSFGIRGGKMIGWLLPTAGGIGLLAYAMHEGSASAAERESLPSTTLASVLRDTGKSLPEAKALYAYLKTKGNDGSPALHNLIYAFQQATGSDPNALHLSGPVPSSGLYDALTSAALTLYTGDPIAAPMTGPSVPITSLSQANDISTPGGAALSGYNLFSAIQKRITGLGLKALVLQFQHDVNTDPKFPGPAVAKGFPAVIHSRLKEDGALGPATLAALKVLTGG